MVIGRNVILLYACVFRELLLRFYRENDNFITIAHLEINTLPFFQNRATWWQVMVTQRWYSPWMVRCPARRWSCTKDSRWVPASCFNMKTLSNWKFYTGNAIFHVIHYLVFQQCLYSMSSYYRRCFQMLFIDGKYFVLNLPWNRFICKSL